ncbi:ATP-grasp domain-containing protein [Chromohalobacter israelensis]|uniref:ATP-grasp domain-containing protein n=1 Tax=Chromohalobacter israelensis (strain ATCC BAA-138 / DSM 3043 / CIP 106854 / NCIMB 13768 / 1H11) TaxID=290398 RepID=Q1QYL8_CHRI1|nr:hypothetical protein [Chromohalobacter salexigens]ABE58440.1 conserved hypothetical protein [Chromohalobacter salexigens DSM 3043]
MPKCAFVTDHQSIDVDFDMPLITDAANTIELDAAVVEWDDTNIVWSNFDLVILRSPWNYTNKLEEFLRWGERVTSATKLINPLDVVKWNLSKDYLIALQDAGVPTVPTYITNPDIGTDDNFSAFFKLFSSSSDFVMKPLVGAYSRDVKRFNWGDLRSAFMHLDYLHRKNSPVLMQPYMNSVDSYGETNLIFIDGIYSHSIRKGALLLEDGTVNPPDFQYRSSRNASPDEINLASQALQYVSNKFNLSEPLLYGRVDIIHDENGAPMILELEVSEPSLSMPIYKQSAVSLCEAIKRRFNTMNV